MSPSRRLHYFAYGSNMHRSAMKAVCPQADALGPAVVHGWRLIFRSAISAEVRPGAVLRGILWSVTPAEGARLDEVEDLPNLYERVDVSAEDASGQALPAFMYVMRPDRVPIAPPAPEYLGLVLLAAWQWDLPEDDIVAAAAHAVRAGANVQVPKLPWNDGRWLRKRLGTSRDRKRGEPIA